MPLIGEDEDPQLGQLLGSLGRFSEPNDGIVGVATDTPIDNDVITELDPTRTLYERPDGWFSDGTTAMTC